MQFKPERFFSLDNFEHNDLLSDLDHVWEVIPKIAGYTEKWLSKVPAEKRVKGKVHESAVLDGEVFVGPGTIIKPFSYIVGPVIIGDNSIIGPSAYIRSNVVIGPDSIIGHASEVKNSILLNRVWASHFAYIGDSIIGNKTELGAGAKIANFRLDEKTIKVKYKQEQIDTGLEKFGAIVGDGVSIGCNSVLNPGAILEKNSAVYPATSTTGYHPQNSVIK